MLSIHLPLLSNHVIEDICYRQTFHRYRYVEVHSSIHVSLLSLLSTANEDFASKTNSFEFLPGDSESCVEVLITDDPNIELNEVFIIELSFAPNVPSPNIPPITTTITIVDNDMGMLLY